MGRDVAQGPDAGCGTGLVGGQWASIRSCGDRRRRSVEGHDRTRASMACIGARAAASVGTCAASGSRAAAPITRSAAASSSATTRKPARSTRCSARRSWAVTSSRRCARAISRRSLSSRSRSTRERRRRVACVRRRERMPRQRRSRARPIDPDTEGSRGGHARTCPPAGTIDARGASRDQRSSSGACSPSARFESIDGLISGAWEAGRAHTSRCSTSRCSYVDAIRSRSSNPGASRPSARSFAMPAEPPMMTPPFSIISATA